MANFSFTNNGAVQGQSPQMSQPLGGSPAGRALNGAQGMPPPIPLIPPMNTGNANIKSHTVTHPDGTTVAQTFHPPQEGLLNKKKPASAAKTTQPATQNTAQPQPAQSEPFKVIDGKHHVQFQHDDGTMKFIDSEGNMH